MNKKNDFEQQWRHLADDFSQPRCPLDEATVARYVRHAVWQPQPAAAEKNTMPRRLRPWVWAGVAAVLLAVALPVGWRLWTGGTAQHVAGQYVVFECNNGCSADNVVEQLNTIIL